MRQYLLIVAMLMGGAAAWAQPASPPATQPGAGRFPYVQVDVKNRQVRVECEALHCEAPLEFFCVVKGGSEHESVIRTRAKPSHIHAALLMIGLEAGEPLKYSEATKKWSPPHGPPLSISMEYDKDGKHYSFPANKLMRDIKSKQAMSPSTWIFAGSRVMPDGNYAADIEGYVVSIVNFDLTLIDVPKLVSSANETLEWEASLDLLPPLGGAMTMIIEPLGNEKAEPAPRGPATEKPTTEPSARLSEVTVDQQLIERLRRRWNSDVKPHQQALQEAAQAQYEVLASLRREQQRLIDEADRIQRLIDQLEQEYQQMTTPRPESGQ